MRLDRDFHHEIKRGALLGLQKTAKIGDAAPTQERQHFTRLIARGQACARVDPGGDQLGVAQRKGITALQGQVPLNHACDDRARLVTQRHRLRVALALVEDRRQ